MQTGSVVAWAAMIIVWDSVDVTTVLAGYDGSPASAAASDTATRLFPGANATIAYLWTSPFADDEMRRRLARRAKSLNELIELIADVVVLEAGQGGERGGANVLVRCAAERQAGVVVGCTTLSGPSWSCPRERFE